MALRTIQRKTFARLLLAACVIVLCVILTAGLWPFNPIPRNEVSWAADERGLWFGDYGIIFSPERFEVKGSTDGSCSLVVWLEPAETYDISTILIFYSEENPRRFRIGQYNDTLIVARDISEAGHDFRTVEMEVPHTFRKGASQLIGISGRPQSTSLYLNGALVSASSTFGLSSQDLRGRIIVGNAPVVYATWGGLLKGLAIYNRGLSSLEMRHMYATWKTGDPDGTMKGSTPVALYLFNEHTGTVIHDRMASGTDLLIPAHFQTVGHKFLQPFWREYYPGWDYWKDLGINVAGFVPLGFCFCIYFATVRGIRRPVLRAVIVGAATSLTIEVLQAFIPTRSSGTTDLITNTLGTSLGAMLSRCGLVQDLLARLGVLGGQASKAPTG